MIPYSLEDLLPLMKEQVRKYTSNESTSIPYSTAQNIMESILYAIETALQPERTTQLLHESVPAKQVYESGYILLKEKIATSKHIFHKIEQNFCSYQNQCYEDTVIKGIPVFFERYDLMYHASHSIITLDYPLLKEDRTLTGIHLIFDYLVKTQLEQNFLHLFPTSTVKLLLHRYDNHYNDTIFNLCKIVLTNVLGCLITSRSVHDLVMEDQDRNMVNEFCNHKSQECLQEILLEKLYHFIQENFDQSNDLLNYFSSITKDIAYEIKFCCEHQCLAQLFPKPSSPKTPINEIYTEGLNMDDNQLRNLIDEMSTMRYLSDKIMLVQLQVKSLSDLKEVLKECFFPGECNSIFPLLSNMEKEILENEIREKCSFDNHLDDWEIEFLEYLKNE